MRRNVFALLLGLFVSIFVVSCEEEKIEKPDANSVEELQEILEAWYLWNDELPTIEPKNYDNPVELMNAVRYLPQDRWSYVTTIAEFEAYYESGAYVGYGYSQGFDVDGKLRVVYVFEDSPLQEYGVERGWIIQKINNEMITTSSDINALLGPDTPGLVTDFVFINPDGDLITASVAKREITMNTVLHTEIKEVGARKVGYLVFKSFIGPSIEELSEAFSTFKANNVDELILDLRYNGGGRMDVTSHLAGLIAPKSLEGEIFAQYEHNTMRESENSSYPFEISDTTLALDRLYVIATRNTASASEALINGLDPFIDVHVVGDNTYGKPVGMYVFYSEEDYYAYVPVTFRISNANGYGAYFEGLAASAYASDNIAVEFGSINEDCFATALGHIETGSFPSLKSSGEIFHLPKREYNSLKDEIGAQ